MNAQVKSQLRDYPIPLKHTFHEIPRTRLLASHSTVLPWFYFLSCLCSVADASRSFMPLDTDKKELSQNFPNLW